MTERGRLDAHPDSQQLAAFVEGRLTGADRARVTTHLADCDECRYVFAQVARDLPVVIPFWRRRKVQALGGGALALAASLLLVVQLRPELNPFRRPTPYEDLVAAVGTNRTIEARLGGFQHGPLRSPTRTGGTPPLRDDYELLAAVARVRKEAQEDLTPDNLRSRGVANLVVGAFDDAIRDLEQANALQPTADGWVALAAAYLARGDTHDRPDDWPKALAAAERAIAMQRSPEALFNRALAMERLRLDEATVRAWDEYLQVDSTSPWAAEARAHRSGLPGRRQGATWPEWKERLTALTPPSPEALDVAVNQFPREVRLLIEDELVARLVSSDREAVLARAALLAHAVAAYTSNREAEQVVAAAAGCVAAGESAGIEGHRRYAHARMLFEADRVLEAERLFESAVQLLDRCNSPLSSWAEFFRGVAMYYRGDHSESDRINEALVQSARARQLDNLRARALWMRGLIATNQARLDQAIEHYAESLALFASMRELAEEASVHRLLWEARRSVGQVEQAWRHAVAALRHAPLIADARRTHSIYISTGQGLLADDYPHVARIVFEAAVANADAWSQAGARCEARLNLSRAQRLLGETSAAARTLRDARAQLGAVGDDVLRRRFEAQLAIAAADLNDASGAIEELSGAIETQRALGNQLNLARMLVRRAELYAKLSRQPEAEADFHAARAVVEEQRLILGDRDTRMGRLEDAVPVFEAWSEYLLIHRKDPVAALDAIEAGRARALLDRVGREPDRAGDLPARIGDHAVIAYKVRGARLDIWAVTRRGIAYAAAPTSDAALRTLVFTATRGDAAFRERAIAALFDLVLRPVADTIRDARRLRIVPDGALHFLPFAMLRDPVSNRPLCDSHTILMSPSVALALRNPAPQALTSAPLVVAVSSAPGFPVLRGARAEARDIARVLPDARVLADDAAGPAEVLSALSSATVAHLATHAISVDVAPLLSRIFVGRGDVLHARSIAAMRLGRTGLVVLAACDTARGSTYRGEGVMGLSRAFLQAGVPRVIGSYWPVDDAAGRALWAPFYEQLKRDGDIETALQSAQRAMRESVDPVLRDPRNWAAFALFGAA